MGNQHAHTKEQSRKPMLLLDVTASMNYPTSEKDETPRRETIHKSIAHIVTSLSENASQSEEKKGRGGLRTITFAGGVAQDIGDLTPQNLKHKWEKIEWGGGTRIVPGWMLLHDVFMDDFGDLKASRRPLVIALVITDGEAEDTERFAKDLQRVHGYVFVVVAIIGFGKEHDMAFEAYKTIEAANDHVKVITLASETTPQEIATTLLKMIER